ncbi:MAG: ribonuclease III [Parachlamydiaceae bacterium]|nr:ribonuclease III [Parachlamydiaceae bacterium]
MKQLDYLIEHISSIEKKLGYTFKDRSHLTLAFVHRSFINENKMIDHHNERLEFLGDSILGMIISDYLYHLFPNTPEGDLSYLRSRLVEAASCVEYIKSLDIASFVLLGKGEKMNDGRGRDSLLADLFEAIIGAIYLDGGLPAAKKFLFSNFQKQIDLTLKTPLKNWKALLQDICQKKFQQTPYYNLINMTGPDHSKSFEISVVIRDGEIENVIGKGIGLSKKEAQQSAAEDALKKLNQL